MMLGVFRNGEGTAASVPSLEKVALGRKLEELERPKAVERKGRPGRARKEKFSSQASNGKLGKVRDLVGPAVPWPVPEPKISVTEAPDGELVYVGPS